MEQASASRDPDQIPTGVMPTRIAALRESLPRWRTRIFWSFQVLFWTAIAAAVLGLSRAVEPTAPTPWLAMVLRVGTGFVISTIVYLVFERARLRGVSRRVRWPLMIAVSLVGLGASVLLLIAGGISGPTLWSGARIVGLLVPRLVTTFFWCASIFGLEMIEDLHKTEILLAENEATAVDLENRMLRAEAAARTLELQKLQEQMNPHFLFNALNAVLATKDDPDAVESVIRDLADYLRFVLGDAGTFEPLSRELHALEKYLGVQQARFGKNLICRVTCDRSALAALVPPMLIQPLLENALNYGGQTSSMPLRVSVTAKVVDAMLEVVVANSGRWVEPDTTRSPSTGIRSLRKRLALLVDKTATVDTVIDPDLDGGWVRVVIRMPATLKPPGGEDPDRIPADPTPKPDPAAPPTTA
jgi:sensor histidine kinase YesM